MRWYTCTLLALVCLVSGCLHDGFTDEPATITLTGALAAPTGSTSFAFVDMDKILFDEVKLVKFLPYDRSSYVRTDHPLKFHVFVPPGSGGSARSFDVVLGTNSLSSGTFELPTGKLFLHVGWLWLWGLEPFARTDSVDLGSVGMPSIVVQKDRTATPPVDRIIFVRKEPGTSTRLNISCRYSSGPVYSSLTEGQYVEIDPTSSTCAGYNVPLSIPATGPIRDFLNNAQRVATAAQWPPS